MPDINLQNSINISEDKYNVLSRSSPLLHCMMKHATLLCLQHIHRDIEEIRRDLDSVKEELW
jgi:hypothetical protein